MAALFGAGSMEQDAAVVGLGSVLLLPEVLSRVVYPEALPDVAT